MEWNSKSLNALRDAFLDRYAKMKIEIRTDRRNLSSIWNRYLKSYGVELLQCPTKSNFRTSAVDLARRLIEVINYENEKVKDSLVIPNPDRGSQYILVPREVAQKILVLGMI